MTRQVETIDLAHLITTLSIQDKDANLVTFPIYNEFAWAQREYLAHIERSYGLGIPIRLIVLKARQLGISTVTAAVFFWWCFLHDNTSALVVTHENKVSSELFDKTKLMWDTWPLRDLYSEERSTLQKIRWRETRSTLQIASARNLGTGRGTTIHACHLSEFASYPAPAELMTGLAQTIPEKPRTIIVIESTARGVGNLFHDMWTNATLGHNDYIPLFFPWWMHFEYRRPTKLRARDLDPDERRYLRLFTSSGNRDVAYLTLPPTITEEKALRSLEWRRWAIANLTHHDEDQFMQEYPATPDEAFLTSGRNVFPLRKLDECFQPLKGVKGYLTATPAGKVKFTADPSGRLTLFKKPSDTPNASLYFAGCDPTRGVTDPACVQVINRRTGEQVAVWHGGIDPQHLAEELVLIGRFFHECEIVVEAEGGGQIVVGALLHANYPRIWRDQRLDRSPGKVLNAYGHSTNFSRKHAAIGHLIYLLGEHSITLHDRHTYTQLRDYTAWGDGEMGNAGGSEHDDAVMSLALACIASYMVGPYVPVTGSSLAPMDLYEPAGS